MSHLSPFTTLPASKPLLTSTYSRTPAHLSSARFHKVFACSSTAYQESHVQRRSVALGLAGLALGLGVGGSSARAARRPPPPPPEEKKDPNVSGVTAKVLASKKRKEAMKESIAKLREKGKPINGPTKESTTQPIQVPSQ